MTGMKTPSRKTLLLRSAILAAAAASGFALLKPDYEVHSVCPACQHARAQTGLPSKFPVG